MSTSILSLLPVPPGDVASGLRREVRTFLRAEFASGRIVPTLDSWLGGIDRAFSRRLGERGWLGMTWPRAYGGHERSQLERFVVLEELLACGAPVAFHWIADRQTGPLLLRFGTERQRREFVPRIARGECSFAIGMSEPDSGSDLASVRARARRVDGGWRVSGTKIWTSSAHEADYMITLVRTSGEPSDRHEGLSQLIVDLRDDDVEIRPIELLTGEHHFNEVVFHDTWVPDDRLVGRAGSGWRQVTSELAFERSGPERFLSVMHLVEAFVATYRAELDDTQAEVLGALVAKLWSLRQMSLAVAASLADGGSCEVEAALVKDAGTRFEQDMIEMLREASRPAGPDDPLAPEPLRSLIDFATMRAPGFTLRGGTNEILRVVIARGLGL